ncbi:MAG: cobyric acid synthase [Bacillota bacterium]
MTARTIMLQGTGSDVGKSILTTALCRILAEDNYRVAPFKAQNMALNSYVTRQQGEIGRAQVLQAQAAGVEPTVDMNPILLKPQADTESQVIIHGVAQQNMKAQEYFNCQRMGLEYIKESLAKLKDEYEAVVLEGAGSPAEVNLRDYDVVNMKAAQLAKAPVLLVANIERGGVFADIVGTFKLLTESEVNRIEGIIINKFRGEISRLEPGLEFIEEYTNVPVVGVIPYISDIKLPEEDSLPQERLNNQKSNAVEIAVLYLPHISNFTDFAPLEEEADITVRYIKAGDEIGSPDLVILPGSKNTIADLEYLVKQGYGERIQELAAAGVEIIGICGGYQMLGTTIFDPQQLESERGQTAGLGLLDLTTTLQPQKVTTQVHGRVINQQHIFGQLAQEQLTGYEIHMGQTELKSGVQPLFRVVEENDGDLEAEHLDGAINQAGTVWGTYLHGIFANDELRWQLINYLREKKGLARRDFNRQRTTLEQQKASIDRLAEVVRSNLDLARIYQIMNDYHEDVK